MLERWLLRHRRGRSTSAVRISLYECKSAAEADLAADLAAYGAAETLVGSFHNDRRTRRD